MASRKLRMGMIGGGKNAFIGAVHRIAANTDGLIELCCGAFNRNENDSVETGKSLFLNPERVYSSYEQMLEKESTLPENKRIDFISIVTPNDAHFAPAMLALEKGFHVVIEKPMTLTLDEAKKLKQKADETGLLLCLTHTYTGYPMVKEAKQIVASGKLGKIRKIFATYKQGWLSTMSEKEGNPQAAWRTDPKKSGRSGVMGDIGTHAFNLTEYITGLQVTEICAQLNTFVEGRMLDDDGAVLLKYNNGASGVLSASQICAGEENNLSICVYGENGGLEWHQMEPNTLFLKWLNKPTEILRAGSDYLSDAAKHNTRTPGGHPEGYLEAFANLYRNFALALNARLEGKQIDDSIIEFTSAEHGVRGMAFIEHVVENSEGGEKWSPFII
jgi:predicted dehydrogenase